MKYYTNSSVYEIINDRYRYVEYLVINGRRIHSLSVIEKSSYLCRIIEKSNEGLSFEDLLIELISEDISRQEATFFLYELIDNQVLISELEPPMINDIDYLEYLIETLENKSFQVKALSKLKSIKYFLTKLDSKIGNDIITYEEIIKIIESLNVDFNRKHLFQVDFGIKIESAQISNKQIESIMKAMTFLNKLSFQNKSTKLNKFKEKFFQRYENSKVPLTLALDPEFGISYSTGNHFIGDVNPLIDDIPFNINEDIASFTEIEWNSINSIIHSKRELAIFNNDYVIKISDNDILEYKAEWDDLPSTLFCIAEFITIDNKTKIIIDGFYGNSAANLLSRFSHLSPQINDFIEDIIEAEKSSEPEVLHSEITHFPEARTGNILMREVKRDYEINYLSLPNKKSKTININDIDINFSDRDNNFILKYRKKNKVIKPYLTTAHNFSNNSLPIYEFLCDVQNEGRKYLGLNYGPLDNIYLFLPRIEYYDIILFKATWHIQIKNFRNIINDKSPYLKLNEWRSKMKIPQIISINEGDNYIVIDFNIESHIQIFLNELKRKKYLSVSEYFLKEQNFIKNCKNENYNGEVILSFYK